jgi:hypothetical protein
VAGTAELLDPVAGADLALADDAQVRPRPAGGGEGLQEFRVAHPDAELEAGKARLGDLELSRADPPAFADQRLAQVDAVNREVVAEGAGPDLPAELRLPPVVVLAGSARHHRAALIELCGEDCPGFPVRLGDAVKGGIGGGDKCHGTLSRNLADPVGSRSSSGGQR